MKTIKNIFKAGILLIPCLLAWACVTTGPTVSTTPLKIAFDDIPESQLLDVGIHTFEISGSAKRKAKKNDAQAEIKKAESHYMPVHLKNTLQKSGYWGAVQVIPTETKSVDLQVAGEILQSNGEKIRLHINVKDSEGNTWLNKRYTARAGESTYSNSERGEVDAFQDVYNRIANDMLRFRDKLTPEEFKKIRTVTALKFAADLAPDAYHNYLIFKKRGKVELVRIPAQDDPMFERLMKIQERDYMFLDTMNQHYTVYYDQMWDSYEKWREFDRTETIALKKIKRKGLLQKIGGAALIVGAVLLDAKTDSGIGSSGALQQVMIIGGMEVIKSGVNVSQQAQMHSAALEEIGESFSAEVRPVIVKLEGKSVYLTGTAQQQYEQWRELLRQIYAEETGFIIIAEEPKAEDSLSVTSMPEKVENEKPIEP